MKEIIRRHSVSFLHAFEGIVWAFKTQPNFRIHLVLSIIALTLSYYLRLTSVETSLIIFAIILVVSGEMINTSIEAVTDLVTNEWRQEAKIAKDVAAGMMLLISVGAAMMATLVFLPHVILIFQ